MKSKRTLGYIFFGSLGQLEQEGLLAWVVDFVHGINNFLDAEISPVANFMLTELPTPNMLRVRGEILCTIFDTFSLMKTSTTLLSVDE